MALVIGGAGIALVLATSKAAAPRKVATLPTSPLPPSPTSPVTGAPTPAPGKPGTPLAPTSRDRLVDLVEAAIYRDVPARRLSPASSRTLALNLVDVCARLDYPLDLAFGHCRAESDLRLNAQNGSSGATGPLQVTRIAAQQVGVGWPISSSAVQLEVGIKYMLWLRRTYPECAASVRTTLRHYGMGRGNWLKYQANGCAGACTSPISVLRAECGCTNRPYSALAIGAAQKHPELRTVPWWGSL